MYKFIPFLFVIGLIIACGGNEPNKSNAKAKKTAAKKGPDGEKIYRQYCVICHGVNGDMGASGAFNLTTSVLSLDEKINVISNGRNTMTPFKGILTEADIKAVAEYVAKFKK